MSRTAALVTAFSLALAPACKKDPEPAPVAKSEPAPAKPGDPPKPEAKADTPPVAGTVPAPVAAAAVAPSYPAALDPLLELVPAGAGEFMVVRDPKELLDDAKWLLTAAGAPIVRASELDKSPDPELRRVIEQFDTIHAAFGASGIDFDRGLVIVGNGAASDVLLFASADVEALNKLFTTIGGGTTSSMKCRALTDVTGFVACAEKDDGTLDKYTAGKSAAALRGELGKALAGVELEHANILGRWRDGDGPEAIAIATTPGQLTMHISAKLDADFETATITGPAPALVAAPKGGSFVWGRLDPAFLAAQSKDAPGIIANVVKTMTGEYFVGALAQPPGLVALAGVSDAGPASGLVPMFSLVQEQVPKELPDGTKLTIAVEGVDNGSGATVQTVHAVATTPEAELLAKIGLVPEAIAFVAGNYGAAVIGADTKAVAAIAKLDGTAAAPAVLETLPRELGDALRGGRASLAVHLELDGLQNPTLRELFTKAAERMPPTSDPAGPSPKQLIDLGLALVAPLSSVSVWTTDEGGPSLVHVALRSFGDPASEEGKAAHAAVAEIDAGKRDAQTVYGELAARYPDSPRAFAYRTRAEASAAAIAPAFSAVFLGGAMAGLVLGRSESRPASEVTRSESAVVATPPAPEPVAPPR